MAEHANYNKNSNLKYFIASVYAEYKQLKNLQPNTHTNIRNNTFSVANNPISFFLATWVIPDFGVCSVNCGPGYQTRDIDCSDGVWSHCDQNTVPSSFNACNDGACGK